jgi:hypothetical protein
MVTWAKGRLVIWWSEARIGPLDDGEPRIGVLDGEEPRIGSLDGGEPRVGSVDVELEPMLVKWWGESRVGSSGGEASQARVGSLYGEEPTVASTPQIAIKKRATVGWRQVHQNEEPSTPEKELSTPQKRQVVNAQLTGVSADWSKAMCQ